jgi:hypothetical protein
MNSTQVGVFEERDEIGLDGFLEGADGGRFCKILDGNMKRISGVLKESQIRLEILSDFPDETLERQLSDQELSGLLVTV